MMKLRSTIAALYTAIFAILLMVSPAGAGSMTLLGAGMPAAAAAAFTGPVDAVASPLGCWSLRACTSALRGNAVANVCNSTGGTDVGCADMLSNATTGDLVPATISGISCPGANCTVKTLYLQSGSLACATSCNLTQATVANRPTLTTSCGTFGKSFCMAFDGSGGGQYLETTGATTSVSVPFTLVAVARRTGVFSSNTGIIASPGPTSFELAWGSTANSDFVYQGLIVAGPSQTDSAWHSMQGLLKAGANSLVNVDGTSGTAGNANTSSALTAIIRVGRSAFSEVMTGNISEVLIYSTDFSSGTQFSTMCHNQFAYWGTSTSC